MRRRLTQLGLDSQKISREGKYLFYPYIARSLADKMPEIAEKLKAEGQDEKAIKEALIKKAEKSIEKYGNKSKVGVLMNSRDLELDTQLLNSDNFLRQKKARNVSEFNRVRIQQNELLRL